MAGSNGSEGLAGGVVEAFVPECVKQVQRWEAAAHALEVDALADEVYTDVLTLDALVRTWMASDSDFEVSADAVTFVLGHVVRPLLAKADVLHVRLLRVERACECERRVVGVQVAQ